MYHSCKILYWVCWQSYLLWQVIIHTENEQSRSQILLNNGSSHTGNSANLMRECPKCSFAYWLVNMILLHQLHVVSKISGTKSQCQYCSPSSGWTQRDSNIPLLLVRTLLTIWFLLLVHSFILIKILTRWTSARVKSRVYGSGYGSIPSSSIYEAKKDGFGLGFRVGLRIKP